MRYSHSDLCPWILLDSYIVDEAYRKGVEARLAEDGNHIGYGIHMRGSGEFDGEHDSFS